MGLTWDWSWPECGKLLWSCPVCTELLVEPETAEHFTIKAVLETSSASPWFRPGLPPSPGQVAEAKSGTTCHTARLRPPPSQRSGSNRKLEPGAWGQMDLKVSHGYVYRCKVMSETTWKLGWTKLMSKENKSFLNQPDSVCCTGQQRWFEGRNVRFEEWGQSVRMFSNKVKEVQSKFSEFDCSHARVGESFYIL